MSQATPPPSTLPSSIYVNMPTPNYARARAYLLRHWWMGPKLRSAPMRASWVDTGVTTVEASRLDLPSCPAAPGSSAFALAPPPDSAAAVACALWNEPMSSANRFLYHKTTVRDMYERPLAQAQVSHTRRRPLEHGSGFACVRLRGVPGHEKGRLGCLVRAVSRGTFQAIWKLPIRKFSAHEALVGFRYHC